MTEKSRKGSFELEEPVPKTPKSSSSNSERDAIKEEVEKIAKNRRLTTSDIIALYDKYRNNESLLEEVLKQHEKYDAKRKKFAQKIARKIYEKYGEGKRPLHEILNKMMMYKKENKWSDYEFNEFYKEIQYLLTGTKAREAEGTGTGTSLYVNRSRISRVLGDLTPRRTTTEEGLRLKDSDHPILAEILSMCLKSEPLHKSIQMHTLMYEDCALVAMTGEFKRDRHIASNFINPLFACMFLPKFDIFEYHMLYSNFGSIIKARQEKKFITNEADALLYYDITTDPNDVVCEVSSALGDIRNRYKVQIALWETVLKLRGGNYYDAEPISQFTQALNSCRNDLFVDTDLAYNQDEGAMLRKLLSVFSLRPTTVATTPLESISALSANVGPYSMGAQFSFGEPCIGNQPMGKQPMANLSTYSYPFSNRISQTNVINIPMITFQIPHVSGPNDQPIDITTATSQTLWVNENKTLVPKRKAIISSKEVLIFYINRRYQKVQIRTFANPLSFSQLPLAMSNFERLNAYPVNIPERISLGSTDETYQLRSVVAINETSINQNETTTKIITGSTGLIMQHRNIDMSIYDQKFYLYDPFGASLPVRHPTATGADAGFILNKPISQIQGFFPEASEMPSGVENISFFDRARTNGTIIIYAKPSGYNRAGSLWI